MGADMQIINWEKIFNYITFLATFLYLGESRIPVYNVYEVSIT